MEWTWLLLLMCPLMMLPIMHFMMKGDHSRSGKHGHEKHLAQELEQLKKQKENM